MKIFHLETDAQSPEHLNTNGEEDILVSDAQSSEHLNTNVMAPPQVGSVSPRADGLTWQDGLTRQSQATSEFVLDGYGATLDDSLTFSERSPMSPGVTLFNNFVSQLPPQRMLTDPNSISDFDCLGLTDPSVIECHSLENLWQQLSQRTLTCLSSILGMKKISITIDDLSVSECGPLDNLKLKMLALCRTPKGRSLGVRHEIIIPSADGKLDLRLQYMQICEPAGSQSGPEAFPDGVMIQVDSLQHEEIVECDATNNGGNVGGEGPSLTAITLSKKNNRKMSEQKCTTDKSISLVDLQQCYGMPRKAAAKRLGVSIATFKRRCRENGILRWPYHNINKDKQSLSTSTRKVVNKSVLGAEGSHNPTSLGPKLLPGAVVPVSWPSSLNGSHQGDTQGSKPPELWGKNNESGWTDPPCSDPASKQATATLSLPMPHVGAKHDTRIVNIKAAYGEDTIRFQMSSTSGIDELKEEVTKRLMLEANTFSIKYLDDEGDWVLIACDADLQVSMNISSSSGNNIIRLLVHDKIDNSRNSSKSCRGLKKKSHTYNHMFSAS
ncbi:hypothetical protein F0562_003140 [Nyssa sinensis]|uniref:PB1 domain-containing protein n=1 Tax=Nyssa sinensis TaxID=561372 RepID=A0A5J5BUC0_9ASTE|nr:hypothetical protein F0562_003140 [Nyssa sinensis]